MAENIVKVFKFPGSDVGYTVNATHLDGEAGSSIRSRITTLEADVAALENFDALRYMGTVAASTTSPGGLTPAANKGDVYKVTSKGYVMGAKVEVGDMLICNKDGTAAATSTNYATVATNWDIIQVNVDVEAILAHTHDITLNKSNKTVTHTVTPTTKNITASFTNGAATVTGNHGHTGSIEIDDATAGGTVNNTDITPAGTVKLTAPTSAGTNDVTITPTGSIGESATEYVTSVAVTISDHDAHNHTGTVAQSGPHAVSGSVTIKTGTGTANYTPAGSVGNSSAAVTAISIPDLSISAHEQAITSSAGGHTPAGTVTNEATTAGGTVASHKHNVKLTPTTDTHNAVGSVTTTYTAGSTATDGTLTIGTTNSNVTYLKSVSVSEDSIAPTFTGVSHNHGASFSGTAVGGHTHTVDIADHDNIVVSPNVTKGNHSHGFTGTAVQLVATHSLSAAAHSHGLTIDNAAAMSHSPVVTAPTSAHAHTFTGDAKYIHAAFTGTKASHNHTFTGAAHNHTGDITINNFTGNFSGTASGTVNVTNGTGVVTGITISDHTISTADSASSGNGKQ